MSLSLWEVWHWEPLLGSTHGKFTDRGVEGQGVSSHSLAMPPTRKVVSSAGRVGSWPKASLTSNLTCFFFWSSGVHSSVGSCGGHSLVCVGASPLHTVLQEFHGLECRWRFPREQLTHSFVGCDHGGLGEEDWCLLADWDKGLWCLCERFWLLEWEHHLLDCPVDRSSLGCLASSAPWGLTEGDWTHLWEHPLLCKVGLADLGPIWRQVPGIAPLYTPPAVIGGTHWELLHTPPGRLSHLHLGTLKGSRWRGAHGLLLWLSQLAVLGSAFSALFSSWRLHCGAGNRA